MAQNRLEALIVGNARQLNQAMKEGSKIPAPSPFPAPTFMKVWPDWGVDIQAYSCERSELTAPLQLPVRGVTFGETPLIAIKEKPPRSLVGSQVIGPSPEAPSGAPPTSQESPCLLSEPPCPPPAVASPLPTPHAPLHPAGIQPSYTPPEDTEGA